MAIDQAYRARGDVPAADQARAQALAFYLAARMRSGRIQGGGRFAASFDIEQELHPAMLAHLNEALQGTRNPIHRARYGDVLWELHRDHRAAVTTIEAYLACVDIYLTNSWYECAVDALDRAAELALSLNHAASRERVKALALASARRLIAAQNQPEVRYALDVLVTLQGFRLSPDEHRAVAALLDTGAAFYRDHGNRQLERAFLQRLPVTYKALKAPGDVHAARLRLAQTFEDEAAAAVAAGEHLRGILFYRDAARAYEEFGEPEKLAAIKLLLQELLPQAARNMPVVATSINVPTEIADAWLNKLLTFDLVDALLILVNAPPQVPSVAGAQAQAAVNRERFPLQHMFGRIVLDERHILGSAEGEEGRVSASERQQYAFVHAFGAVELGRALDRLEAEKGLSADVWHALLAENDVIDEATLPAVDRGIERYFAHDYVSALHILVPQLEDTMRGVLDRLHIPRVSMIDGQLREMPLNMVLDTPEVQALLGEDVVAYFKMLLLQHDAGNIRHRTAHGLLKAEHCTRELTQEILSCFLLLLRCTSATDADEMPSP